MPSPLADLLASAVMAGGPVGATARAVALNAAERGQITGDEAAGRARLTAWLGEPGGGVALVYGAPASGTTTLLARWLPEAAALGFAVVWIPLHRALGLGTERAALTLLCAALVAGEPRLTFARRPEAMWRWCARALACDRDPDDGDSPLLVVIDGLHEAAGDFLVRHIGAAVPGDHVKLLLTDHQPPSRPDVRAIDGGGTTPPGMRRCLTDLLEAPGEVAARLRALRTLAASPHPVPPGVLRRLAGDGATEVLLESEVCAPPGSGGARLAHGAYRALLVEANGPVEEAPFRADLGEVCLVTREGAREADTRALVADLVGGEWPSLAAASSLLEAAWLRERCRSGGGVLDALLDVRRARAAALTHLALVLGRDLPPSPVTRGAQEERAHAEPPSPAAVPALRVVAECAVWEASLATLAHGRILARKGAFRWRGAALARRLSEAHEAGPPEAPRAETAPGRRGGSSGEHAPPVLAVLRRRWQRGVPTWGRATWLAALAADGRTEEALAALRTFGPIPFMRAQVALAAAAELPGDPWTADLARSAVLTLEPTLRPALVGTAPGAACAVLGLEETFALASEGPEYRRLEAWTRLLPHLPAENERERAAREAFGAWSELPPGDDAEGMILVAAPCLPRREALAVMDRLLAGGAELTVKRLLSPGDPAGLVAHLPLFSRLGGAPGRAAAWDALAGVAAGMLASSA